MIAVVLPVLAAAPASALAAEPPSYVSFTLEGCRLPVNNQTGLPLYTLPLNGKFICKEQAVPGAQGDDYTSGNLGKSWNELDLVPYRVMVDSAGGRNDPATSTFYFLIVLDGEDAGKPGYDVISEPTLNPGSDAGCPVPSVSGQLEATPGLGGTDTSIYREVTLTAVPKDANCAYDYYGRLALGSHLYPGASLHGNLALYDDEGNPTTQGIGARDVSIPVNEIAPQELRKDMSASQDREYTWNLTKEAMPASLNFENTCAPDAVLSAPVEITVEWQRIGPLPSGDIAIVANVYAVNPANRPITVNVQDTIYSDDPALSLAQQGFFPGGPGPGADVVPAITGSNPSAVVSEEIPANTQELVLTHTLTVAANTPNLYDVATATYTDTATGIPVPGNTTIRFPYLPEDPDAEPGFYTGDEPFGTGGYVSVQVGDTLDATAVITDEETITGAGLTFSADSFAPDIGDFDGGYVAGTATDGPVGWTSDEQSGDGSVTFSKTVYVAKGTIETDGHLHDVATVTGSDGFEFETEADITITVNTVASLTIEKTLNSDILQGAETATFDFVVKDAGDNTVATPSITFGAGDVTKSIDVTNLTPGSYMVYETPPEGWSPSDPISVDLSADACSGTASFENSYVAFASAEVVKVTDPVGFEGNWTFDLYKEAGDTDVWLETVTTTGATAVPFTTELGEGSYYVLETEQDGWTSDGGDGCTFTVNLPADADTTFTCTFTNTYEPSVTITKTGDELSKGGDDVTYDFYVENTGSAGEAAGAPSLECVVSDDTIGYESEPFTLLPGGTWSEVDVEFMIPLENYNDEEFVNEATVNCTYPGLSVVVATADSDFTTDLFHPSISVSKSGPAYALPGDTVTYTVDIENTSDAKTPTLVVESIADTLAGTISVVSGDDCYELEDGETCSLTYTYAIPASATDTVTNEVTATYNPTGFSNDVSDKDDHDITILEPSFTITKACSSDEPVPQEGPAEFEVTVTNTGNADLVVEVGDGIGTVILPVGDSQTFTVTIDGPFSGQATVFNDVSATASLASSYLVTWTDTKTADDECDVGARVELVKRTNGVTDPTYDWDFAIWEGPHNGDPSSWLSDPQLATDTTLGDADGILDFGNVNLDPTKTYTICELATNAIAGWTQMWTINGVTVPAYDPGQFDTPMQSLGYSCVDFGAGTGYDLTAGGTLTIELDNDFPGGEPMTPGYWKNWSSCTGGGQYAKTTDANDPDNEFWSLDELLNNPGFDIGLMHVDGVWNNDKYEFQNSPYNNDCVEAVRILDKSDASTGKKMANDAAYELATAYFASKLNYAAGAEQCPAATTAQMQAQALLTTIGFDGDGEFLGSKVKGAKATQRTQALSLAKTLDLYNNGLLCV